ncbi:hypothetical protein niasHS_011330 [Heterodera schachtii]|uniref:BTB domain-containing protein n=1 Tax=Heterodera schachtii TaxID=97005 RepID=A0ABD2IMM6_HETSC
MEMLIMSKPLAERMKNLLSTGEDADVYFLVGDGDEKELVSAHKLILKHSSDVFEAMFCFDAKKEKVEFGSADCPVKMPDVEAAAFKVMLSFIYAEDLSGLNGDNAMAVLYAAKKYNILSLVGSSLQILFSEMRNVFFAYAQARLFDLENYVSDCLDYIDKNADTLLKSEEFLQIDQKTFCEILERDELQISGEISIWNAARCWADEKCRQNGIDCSAENRRQMLGPALFNIRFPLLSNEEFTKNIVPFGVLSKDEMIAIYQFNSLSNCHGISDGLFPMPFPTNGRISDRKEGTLFMDIEKISEFAREEIKSSQFSEKVYINGLPWEIWAQIENKDESTDNNEKWLAIYLLCDAPEEDSLWRCCVRSATFRIISQKNGTENSVGTLSNFVVDNKLTNLGFPNFVSFAELMDLNNGFYDREEDKVKLTIDVTTVDEPKVDKFILNQSKSNGTISMEIEKVSEFAREIIESERKSETVHIKGLPWKILAEIKKKDESIDNEKWLGIFLWCDAPEEENWSYKCSATLRIVSQKNKVPDSRREFDDRVFDNKTNSWGFFYFISFAELMNPSKGFYNKSEDKVTVTIDFIVKEAKRSTKHKCPI